MFAPNCCCLQLLVDPLTGVSRLLSPSPMLNISGDVGQGCITSEGKYAKQIQPIDREIRRKTGEMRSIEL